MKKLSLLVAIAITFAFGGCGDTSHDEADNGDKAQTYTMSLPEYTTHTLDLGDTQHPVDAWQVSYDEGKTSTHYYQTLLTDKSKLFEFDCFSTKEFGTSSNTFAFTNCEDNSCPDFELYNYRAMTKQGVNNHTYVIVGADGYPTGRNSDIEPSIRFKDNKSSDKTKKYHVKGLYLTNCFFTYNSMKNGSDIFGGIDKFGEKDSFKVIIYNSDKTQSVEYNLATGTQFVTTWKWVDLSSLAKTDGLKFEVKAKSNNYGNMTPTYFCLDGITLTD